MRSGPEELQFFVEFSITGLKNNNKNPTRIAFRLIYNLLHLKTYYCAIKYTTGGYNNKFSPCQNV
jgi:hypothetical protein